jgi:hypothetical protein
LLNRDRVGVTNIRGIRSDLITPRDLREPVTVVRPKQTLVIAKERCEVQYDRKFPYDFAIVQYDRKFPHSLAIVQYDCKFPHSLAIVQYDCKFQFFW